MNKTNYMNHLTLRPDRFAFRAGLLLVSLSFLFWIAAIFFMFGNTSLFDLIFTPIDKTSPLLSIMIMIVLPLIAAVINMKSVMSLRIGYADDILNIHFRIARNYRQWLLIGYCGCCIAFVFIYSVTENFILVAR